MDPPNERGRKIYSFTFFWRIIITFFKAIKKRQIICISLSWLVIIQILQSLDLIIVYESTKNYLNNILEYKIWRLIFSILKTICQTLSHTKVFLLQANSSQSALVMPNLKSSSPYGSRRGYWRGRWEGCNSDIR